MKILITGAAGFIGFHLSRKILETTDNTVVGIDNLNDYYPVNLKEDRLAILSPYKNSGNECSILILKDNPLFSILLLYILIISLNIQLLLFLCLAGYEQLQDYIDSGQYLDERLNAESAILLIVVFLRLC